MKNPSRTPARLPAPGRRWALLLLGLTAAAACSAPPGPALEPVADPLAAVVALVNAEPTRRIPFPGGMIFDSTHAVQEGACQVTVRRHMDAPWGRGSGSDPAVASETRVPVALLAEPATYVQGDLAWRGYFFVSARVLTGRAELPERRTLRSGTSLEQPADHVRLTFHDLATTRRAVRLLGQATRTCRAAAGGTQP